jgi:hypothetical protein
MSEVFLLSALQSEPDLEDNPSSAGPLVKSILKQAGLRAERLNEVHWLYDPAGNPPAAEDLDHFTAASVFQWPDLPLIDHYLLQSCARSARLGDSHLILLLQTWQGRSAAALIASPQAVGRYNLAPAARIFAQAAFRAGEGEGQLPILAGWMERRRRVMLRAIESESEAQPEQEGPVETLFPLAGEINWLASVEPVAESSEFAAAKKLFALPPAPEGDLFLLAALYAALRNSRTRWGLMLTEQREGAFLASLLERIEPDF